LRQTWQNLWPRECETLAHGLRDNGWALDLLAHAPLPEAEARECFVLWVAIAVFSEHLQSLFPNCFSKRFGVLDKIEFSAASIKAHFYLARSDTVSGAPSPSPPHRRRIGQTGRTEKRCHVGPTRQRLGSLKPRRLPLVKRR
jgi:hypothetical protein